MLVDSLRLMFVFCFCVGFSVVAFVWNLAPSLLMSELTVIRLIIITSIAMILMEHKMVITITTSD